MLAYYITQKTNLDITELFNHWHKHRCPQNDSERSFTLAPSDHAMCHVNNAATNSLKSR